MKIEITNGQRFGRLTVIREGETLILPSKQKNRTAICQCDCGEIKQIRLLHLTRNRIQSCGCEDGIHSSEKKSKIYLRWKAINYRCHISPYYNGYIDKGITVCDQWRNSYPAFKEWALNNGFKEGLQIDRIDNTKGYSPDNCRFVTNLENVNNRSNTFNVNYYGRIVPFMKLIFEKDLLMHASTIRCRIKRGWSDHRAFDQPFRSGSYKKVITTKEEAMENWKKQNRHHGNKLSKRCIKREVA